MTSLHISFIALFVAAIAVRAYYHRKSGTFGEPIFTAAEGRLIPTLRYAVGFPWLAGMLVYIVHPGWMTWSALPLPDWMRWIGIAVGAGALALLSWVHHALGRNFSTVARIRDDHRLVTDGPYRLVRHPMYPALWLFALGALLLSANWFVGLPPLLIVTAIMLIRPATEEAQLIIAFGDDYRAYMARTGRFLPRLRWANPAIPRPASSPPA
jgi:protein-S-isoprenylcysteine O-methyltransferase Ste14